MRTIHFCFIALALSSWLHAESVVKRKPASLGSEIQEKVNRHHRTARELHLRGIYIVGGWAIANIGVGLYGESQQSKGEKLWFYRSMWTWNLINLGIAGLGYFATTQDKQKNYTLEETTREVAFSQNFYMKMMVLDLAYVGAGYLMYELGVSRRDSSRNKLLGFGKGIVFQGAALLVMDLINYYSQKSNTEEFYGLLSRVSITDTGLQLRVPL